MRSGPAAAGSNGDWARRVDELAPLQQAVPESLPATEAVARLVEMWQGRS